MGEFYAAAVLGLLLLLLVMAAALILKSLVPSWIELGPTPVSKLGLVLFWAVASIVSYCVLVPQGRYRTWSEDFRARHELARKRPAFMEVVAIGSALLLLAVGLGLNLLRDVLST